MVSNQKKPSFYSRLLTGDVRSGWTLVVGIILSLFMLVGVFDTAMPLLAIAHNSLVAAPAASGQRTPPRGSSVPVKIEWFSDKGKLFIVEDGRIRECDAGCRQQYEKVLPARWKPPVDPNYNSYSDQTGEGSMFGLTQGQCVSMVCVVSSLVNPQPYYYVPFGGIRGGEYANGNFAGIVLPIDVSLSSAGGDSTGVSASNMINAVYTPGAPAAEDDNKSKN